MIAGRLDDHAEFEHAVADRRGLLGRRFEGVRVADHLDAEVQPDAVHGADDRVLVLQRLQSRLQMCADACGVLLQSLVAQHVEDGDTDRARQRAAAGRREEVALTGKPVGDRPAGDHRAERIAVAGRLRDRHDVGDDVLLLKAPEPFAEPAVPDLHLVGRSPDRRRRARPRTPAAGSRPAAPCRPHCRTPAPQMNAAGARPSAISPSICGHRLVRVAAGIGAAELAAEAVGRLHRVHPIRPGGKRIRVVGDRRRHRVGGVRPPVVGLADRDHVASARRRHRQPHRQIACLRTGVDQEHGVQRLGQRGGQPLAELDHRLVVEPRVRVELAQLTGGGVGDPRMGVAEHRDVVDHVEVATGRPWTSGSAASRVRSAAAVRSSAPAPARSSRRGATTDRLRGRVSGRAGSPSSGRGSRVSASQPGASSARRQLRRRWGTDRPHTEFGPLARARRPRAGRRRAAGSRAPVPTRHRQASARSRRPRKVRRCHRCARPPRRPTARRRGWSAAGHRPMPVAHDVGAVLAQRRGPAQPRLSESGDDQSGAVIDCGPCEFALDVGT